MKKINIRFQTITKKCIIMIFSIGILLVLCVNLAFPSVFYQIMKPYFINHVSNLVKGTAVRQSYILTNNRPAYLLKNNAAFLELVAQYDQNESNQTAWKEQINTYFPVQSIGKRSIVKDSGAISATSYMMMVTNQDDAFFNQDISSIASSLLNSDWFNRLPLDITGQFHYSPPISSEAQGQTIDYFCFTYSFLVGDTICWPIVITNFNDIKSQYQELESMDINDYTLICGDQILYSNVGQDSKIALPSYPASMSEGVQYEPRYQVTPQGIDFLVRCSYSYEDLKLAVHIPKETLLAPYTEIFQVFQVILFLIIFVFALIIGFTLKGILGRLTKLNKKMNRIRNGDYGITLTDEKNDEIGSLVQTFHLMLSKIKDDMSKIVQHEKKEQQMQYSLMVSAIDPHFIYNTLNTITFLAEMDRSREIVAVNDALIGTLKDRLKMKNYKTFDTVKVEKEVLEQYMLIQHYLCHNHISLHFNVAEEDLTLQIPKNILQPIVENSIKHGILLHKNENREIMDGLIKVSVSKNQDSIILEVSDNGLGMDPDTIHRYFECKAEFNPDEEDSVQHIGIKNIQMRLSYLYHGKFSLTVKSAHNAGTIVTIVLPIYFNPSEQDPESQQ